GRKLRDHRGTAVMKDSAEEGAVDAIVLKIFIDADEVLVAIAEIRRIENTTIQHWKRARNIFNGCRICLAEVLLLRSPGIFYERRVVKGCYWGGANTDICRHISIQDVGSECAGVVCLGKGK